MCFSFSKRDAMSFPTTDQFNSAHNSSENFWKLIFQKACFFTLDRNKFFPCICPETACILYSINSQPCRSFKHTAFRMLCFHTSSLLLFPFGLQSACINVTGNQDRLKLKLNRFLLLSHTDPIYYIYIVSVFLKSLYGDFLGLH